MNHGMTCTCTDCTAQRRASYGPLSKSLIKDFLGSRIEAEELIDSQDIIEAYWEPRNAAEFHKFQCDKRGERHLKLVKG